jgi:hypothetical protein
MEKIHYINRGNSFYIESYLPYCNIHSFDSNFNFKFNITDKKPFFELQYTKNITEDEVKKYYKDKLNKVVITEEIIKVVELDDKISLRYHHVEKVRPVGSHFVSYKKTTKFITINTKTKNIYFGDIKKFNKKVIEKKIYSNAFYLTPFSELKFKIVRSPIFNNLDKSKTKIGLEDKYLVGNNIFNSTMITFSDLIYNKTNFRINKLSGFIEGDLFKLYLNLNNISYPNTFLQYMIIKMNKKDLIKHKNLVTYFMHKNNLKGKKVRHILNHQRDMDFNLILNVYHNLGVDYFNNVRNSFFMIDHIINGYHPWNNYFISDNIQKFNLTNNDKKMIVNLINSDSEINWGLIKDHLNIINELRTFNEHININFKSREEFNEEHYRISELLNKYKEGEINRIYCEDFINDIEREITMNGVTYYPKVLLNTFQYMEESRVQSNCVKTYIEKAESLIISLRLGSPYSTKRATIEYNINKYGLLRVQTRGVFNQLVDEVWEEYISILDNRISLYKPEVNFKLPSMTKKFSNGKIIEKQSCFYDKNDLQSISLTWVGDFRLEEIDEYLFDN